PATTHTAVVRFAGAACGTGGVGKGAAALGAWCGGRGPAALGTWWGNRWSPPQYLPFHRSTHIPWACGSGWTGCPHRVHGIGWNGMLIGNLLLLERRTRSAATAYGGDARVRFAGPGRQGRERCLRRPSRRAGRLYRERLGGRTPWGARGRS